MGDFVALVTVLLHGMGGLGDNIYQRPFVRDQAQQHESVYLSTPWPEIYHDLSIKPLPWNQLALRTQAKNTERFTEWAEFPEKPYFERHFNWSLRRPQENIVTSLVRTFGPKTSIEYDLPDFGPSPVKAEKLAVLRPVTLRTEWWTPARNPLPEYVYSAGQILREEGYHVVSVADIEPPQEVIVGKKPLADTRFHKGELHVTGLLALIQHADVVVGGVGWIVPAAISAGVPLVVIGGGRGRFDHPDRLTDRKYMDLSKMEWILPDPLCLCGRNDHECPKTIRDFDGRFRLALERLA